MGFTIGYERLLTLNCWHPAYLGLAAGWPTLPARGPLTDAPVQNDLLAYDLRRYLLLEPTPGCARRLKRQGLQFRRSTTGGWLLGRDSYLVDATSPRLTLAVYPLPGDFISRTIWHQPPGGGGQVFELTNDAIDTGTPGEIHLLSDGDLSGRYRDLSEEEEKTLRPGLLGLVDLSLDGFRGQSFDLNFEPKPDPTP